MKRHLLIAFAFSLAAGSVLAQVRVREMHVQPLAAPDRTEHRGEVDRGELSNAVAANAAGEPTPLAVYPVAGTVGRDLSIPYYVDLDPTSVKRDWHCTDLTFNGHTGHDPYARSFSEQRIGVPVFAVRDGTVIDVRDGQADENTSNQTNALANYVVIRHDDDEVSQYVHLRKGIPVKVGDTVTAGTQIGWVGSSGQSMGPHIHFETRLNDVPIEPMAGPCRPGRSLFPSQPTLFDQPIVVGTTFSDQSFGSFAAPPHDDAPHVGTFVQGQRRIYFKAELANIGASTRYALMLQRPGSTRTTFASSGVLTTIDVSLASIWWALDVNLDRPGTWAIVLELNDRRLFSIPFTVVATQAEVVNRVPSPVTPQIEPVALHASEVAVCRATSPSLLPPDPDYDVVRYRYQWNVNGTVVRDVTTAATSDALARQHVTPGAQISCSITASDGKLSATTVTAHATPVTTSKRRASRS
ncbi:MAG TPA: M23 family metallopeptidase [Thermoanaerobaculia bacterium]|jgi:hypothetical protein